MIQHFHLLFVRHCDVHHADTAEMEKDTKTIIVTEMHLLQIIVLQ